MIDKHDDHNDFGHAMMAYTYALELDLLEIEKISFNPNHWARILVQVTTYRRLLIDLEG